MRGDRRVPSVDSIYRINIWWVDESNAFTLWPSVCLWHISRMWNEEADCVPSRTTKQTLNTYNCEVDPTSEIIIRTIVSTCWRVAGLTVRGLTFAESIRLDKMEQMAGVSPPLDMQWRDALHAQMRLRWQNCSAQSCMRLMQPVDVNVASPVNYTLPYHFGRPELCG